MGTVSTASVTLCAAGDKLLLWKADGDRGPPRTWLPLLSGSLEGKVPLAIYLSFYDQIKQNPASHLYPVGSGNSLHS